MTKDCQCHRLFYPTLIRSCCSSNYVNPLKTKTTISPVITTLRTIGVMQRKKRKNEDLPLSSKLSKPSYQLLNSHSPTIGKRTLPQDLFEYEYHQFKQTIPFSSEHQSFRLVNSHCLLGIDYDAQPKQGKFAKRITNQTELSRVSNTFTNISSDNNYNRRNNRYGNSDYHQSDSDQGKENCSQSPQHSHGDNNPWVVRPVSIEQGGPFSLDASPKMTISEDRGDQFIFTMSPFSSTQTLSTFIRSSANPPESYNFIKSFEPRHLKTGDLAEESDEDEDQRPISITSVLPIDIPQSHKSI